MGVSHTSNLSVTSPILYHYITAPTHSTKVAFDAIGPRNGFDLSYSFRGLYKAPH